MLRRHYELAAQPMFTIGVMFLWWFWETRSDISMDFFPPKISQDTKNDMEFISKLFWISSC